jgi:predicted HAD superfamily Cof-like phosphohydrolase
VAADNPAPEGPTIIPTDRIYKRVNWMMEECHELINAEALEDQADAFLDILYFALGGMIELGLEMQPLFDIVHGANMSKLQDGVAIFSEEGKVLKPEGWTPPEARLREEIGRQIEARGTTFQ